MDGRPIEVARDRGRASARERAARLRGRGWQIGQCAVAAALAWLLAAEVLGHPDPVFAPIAAVVSLGTSYGQRLRRVAEVTAGVAIGVLLGDLLVLQVGTGWWQIGMIVALAMVTAVLLDAGTLFVTQAAIQSIFVAALVPGSDAAFTRWTDALVGGAVALAAATVVPAAPLRRPRDAAAGVLRTVSDLLRGAADVMADGDVDHGLTLLEEARSTDWLVRRLQHAADEGMAVVSSSPFRVRHKPGIRRMADLVEPLDRALRSTRVLVRQVAVAAYHRRPVPAEYIALTRDLAEAIDGVVAELEQDRLAEAARPALLAVGEGTGRVQRAEEMTAEVVLAQVRSVVVDVLMITGLDQQQSTDAIPPTPH